MSTQLLLEEWLRNRNELISEHKSLRSRQRHSILTMGELKMREAQARYVRPGNKGPKKEEIEQKESGNV